MTEIEIRLRAAIAEQGALLQQIQTRNMNLAAELAVALEKIKQLEGAKE